VQQNRFFSTLKHYEKNDEGRRNNWERVCKNQLGVRIRRQHPIWKFIADFYCHEVKLVIEIDGGIHLTSKNKEYDISRNITLNEFGVQIIRFTNDQVINEIDKVIEEVRRAIEILKLKKNYKSNQNSAAG